jgi:hypothetical protein
MSRRSRYAGLGLWLTAAVLAQACAEPRVDATPPAVATAAGDCSSRIVVGFFAAADASVVAAVAQASGARLTVVNRLLPDLYVLDLSAAGAESACAAALERVRADARVRFADPDTRREPNAG